MKNIDLADLVVLIVDCQTTGANPKGGSIIEIGWARSDVLGSGEKASGINVRIFKKQSDFQIPLRVRKITGIENDEITAGSEPAEIWMQVLTTANAVAGLNTERLCPTVIHFAKFEIPFLVDLHSECGDKNDFPFTFICTHEISKRLFPELPRRSIRAIAGYLGYSIHELRRCKEHVHATSLIWRAIVQILRERHKIKNLEQLMGWLNQPNVLVSPTRSYPMSARALQGLPQNPGVYRMLRSNGDILYVGKAKSLKSRIRSYFRKGSRHPEHILEMLSQAKRLDLTVAESDLEASLLESDQIKRFAPPYNVALRKADRQIWFCSNDLCEFNSLPTTRYRIGPIVNREAISSFAAIVSVVDAGHVSGVTEELLMKGIGVSEAFAPDLKYVRAGYEIFLRRHADILRRGSAKTCLTTIARELWVNRHKDKVCEDNDMEILTQKSVETPVWTPDAVCRLIEQIIMHAGCAIRRARWLTLLTESSLGWLESLVSDESYFLIVFEKGQILYRRTCGRGELPIPPGYSRPFVEKQRSFDIMTYDRMRVMTTGLRRLTSTRRWVQIRLTPAILFGGEKLNSLLSWV